MVRIISKDTWVGGVVSGYDRVEGDCAVYIVALVLHVLTHCDASRVAAMPAPGLTSAVAQSLLHAQVWAFTASHSSWPRKLIRPPHLLLSTFFTVTAALFLLVDYSVGDRRGETLFQSLILLLLALFAFAQHHWEVYILCTRQMRQLRARIAPLLTSPCPWSASSYPKDSISTLRSHITVQAYRDGTVVNLPTSLLVEGDVMILREGVASPARARLLPGRDASGCGEGNDMCVEIGDTAPPELFGDEHGVMADDSIQFTPLAKAPEFVVTQTPIISILESMVGRKRSKSFLTRERDKALNVLCLLTVGTCFLSLIFNIVRFASFPDDFGNGTELLLRLQTYVVLPLLHLAFPFLWTLVNLYGTARIVLLVEHGPGFFTGTMGLEHIQKVWLTFRQMLLVLFQPSHFPNYRVFHILGAQTSFCAIDKEYVLTSSSPTPEMVFFLTCTRTKASEHEKKLNEEVEGKEKGDLEVGREEEERSVFFVAGEEPTTRSTPENALSSEDCGGQVEINLELENCSRLMSGESFCDDEAIDSAAVNPHDFPDSAPQGETNPVHKSSDDRCSAGEARVTLQVSSEIKGAGETVEHLRLPVPSGSASLLAGDSVSVASTLSDAVPLEVSTEIMDLSPVAESLSGLAFDNVNWEEHIASLKPMGVNVLATSHLLADPYKWCPYGSTNGLRTVLSNTACACSLGFEIGVTQFSRAQFSSEFLLYSVGGPPNAFPKSTLPRRTSSSFFNAVEVVQPYIISTVQRDTVANSLLLMSSGSADMVSACCTDFWDGSDLQPMTDLERGTILDFFNRRSLTAYCVALAYNPLLDVDLENLKNRNLSMFIPDHHVKSNFGDISMATLSLDGRVGQNGADNARLVVTPSTPAEEVFSCLQCRQVFLGMVSLQFQPKHDVVSLVEDLKTAGIRFVHFTAENEVRGKIFAEKLTLEAGWNCHISLAPADEDEASSSGGDPEPGFGGGSIDSSATSSLSSVFNAYQSYIRAKLPKGIERIRPHISHVDNVPLLVPLFTDCTTDAIQGMMEIMQENGEVVVCLGNSWNRDNLKIFSQADISIAVMPEYIEATNCLSDANRVHSLHSSLSGYQVAGTRNENVLDATRHGSCQSTWPQPLEMASYLNSTTCQLFFDRTRDVSVLSLVSESRHILSCIRRGLLFALGSSLAVSILMLLATLVLLPPPLAGHHLFWFLLFAMPLLTLSYLSTPVDPKTTSQMPDRKNTVWVGRWWYFGNFALTFALTASMCLLLFALTLHEVCSRAIPDSSCHPLFGNRNDSTNGSVWNGWRGNSEQGLLFSQDLTALFFALYLVCLSLRFVHRTAPIHRLWKFTSWQYILVTSLVLLMQVVYFALSQSVATQVYHFPFIASLSFVPFYVWMLGLAWPVVIVLLQEGLKWRDRTMFVKRQRHLKLEFGTKLGMNSPF